MVIALVVTPDGLPLAYEVMAGNTSDKTTLRDFIERIEAQYGKATRTWVMDRSIPTEEVLAGCGARRDKEQAMRRRRLKKLIKRLQELRRQKLTRDHC